MPPLPHALLRTPAPLLIRSRSAPGGGVLAAALANSPLPLLERADGFTALKERAGVKGWCARFSSGSGPGSGHAEWRPGSRSAPCWTNDLDAGRHSAHAGRGRGRYWLVGWRAPCAVRVPGRLAAAFVPSGVPAAGCRGGMGRVRVRAAGSIRQAASPPGAGPVKPAITRCPRPGLLTRAAPLGWPGIGPGRRAWRRRIVHLVTAPSPG